MIDGIHRKVTKEAKIMLPIHEQFYTFQGEGTHSGQSAYFIRTFGCPIHCPWCDSSGTWHPEVGIFTRTDRGAHEIAHQLGRAAGSTTILGA